MNAQTKTIRPGILVSLKTSVGGSNISYQKTILEAEHAPEAGSKMTKARWETERTVEDANEYERANAVRSKAAYAVYSNCLNTAFGLLCPEQNLDKLQAAIGEARKMCDDFNRDAKITFVRLYVLCGRVASDDAEAARAINSEMASLVEKMEDAIRSLSGDKIREAARRLRETAAMLPDEAKTKMDTMLDGARASARAIAKAAKTGEQAAVQVDEELLKTLSDARMAFLDFDQNATQGDLPQATARVLDMEL